MNIMKSHALILADPAPTVEVLDLADNKVNLAVRSWVRTADYWQARCDVLEQVKERFGEAGIEVPYPKQELACIRIFAGRLVCLRRRLNEPRSKGA